MIGPLRRTERNPVQVRQKARHPEGWRAAFVRIRLLPIAAGARSDRFFHVVGAG